MPRTVSRRTRSSARRRTRAPKPVAAKPAVLYARVSSREQEREGYSIAAQQELLRKYAEDNEFQILEEFVDVETAKKTGRVRFGEMLKFLKRRHASKPVVLVEKTDRLYRNLKDWVSLDETGVDVHLVKEGIVISDDSRSSERFVHGIKVLMAKNYVDNLSEEVRKGMNQKASEGYWPSSAPSGYINRREAGRSYIVPDPDRAILVRNLFELYDTGQWSVKRLGLYAHEQGFRGKRGGRIQAALVHTILRNPLYAGRFFWGGELFEGRDPRLITPELFERVQQRLDGTPYTRPRELKFAYGGLLTCGHCGAAITAEIKKKKYVYYRCSQRCEATAYVREERVREQYIEAMRALRLPEAVQATVKRALRQTRASIEDNVKVRVAAAQERIERLGRLIDKAYEDKLEGRIEDAFFTQSRMKWEAQRTEAAREVERLTRASAKSLDVALVALELANAAYELMYSREAMDQRELLEIVLSNSSLTGDVLAVDFRKPYSFLANRDEPPKETTPSGGGSGGGCTEWSGWPDSNRRPPAPKAGALPGCATPRVRPRNHLCGCAAS